MTDADIHAFGPDLHADTRPAATGAKRRPRAWRWGRAAWALGFAVLLSALVMVALGAAWVGALVDGSTDAVHVVVNGQAVDLEDSSVWGLGTAASVGWLVGGALALALVLTLVTVLFVLPLVLGVALFGLAFALGAAVLSVAGAAALALSPLLLLGLLVWLAFRAGRRRVN